MFLHFIGGNILKIITLVHGSIVERPELTES
jgi:hypothetical protein